MKYALLQIGLLTAVVALVAAGAYHAVATRWGGAGVTSLSVAALICWVAALLAAVPLSLAATYWREYIGQAAFAGTAIRLLVTGTLAVAYQMFAVVHLASFLACLLVLYLVLLAAETTLAVVLIKRLLGKLRTDGE